jgi:cytochrome P450
MRRTYGDVLTYDAHYVKLVLALSPEGTRQVLTADPDGYGPFQTETFTGLTGPGSLWVVDNTRHRRERRLLAPAFHEQRIRDAARTMQEITRRYTDQWQPGQQIRAYDEMLAITRDVILRVVFGVEEGGALAAGRTAMARLLRCVTPMISFVPLLQSSWYPPWRRYRRARQEFTGWVERCLAERRARGGESRDVLGLLLAARYDDGSTISDDEIQDELVTILLSGYETTAVAVSWAIYELGRHPDVLARLRAELDSLGPDPEPDQLVRQPYLNAVCHETLRLHTILTEIARMVRTPLEVLGYSVPAGAGVGVGICAIHQDPALYPEPDRFRPERFVERTYTPYEFLPFGGGHRRCLGAALAEYQLRLALTDIVTRWDLAPDGEDEDVRRNIGMGPKHGVRMRVVGRRGAP